MAIKVDLLPTERKKFGFDVVIAIMAILFILCGGAFYMIGGNLEKEADAQEQEVVNKQKELEEAKKGIAEIDVLNKKIRDLEGQIKLVKGLKLDPVRYSNLLDELALLLPNNMWVTSVNIDPSKQSMVIVGVAAEQPGVRPVESISGFMKNVGRSKFFRSAAISNTTRGSVDVGKNKYTSYSWNIELIYDADKAMNAGTTGSAPERC